MRDLLRLSRAGILAAAAVITVSAAAVYADVGFGPPVALDYGKAPVLKSTLRPSISSESDPVHYQAHVTFRIGTKHLGSIPSFAGTATPTPERLTLHVGSSTLAKIKTYARAHHNDHVRAITTLRWGSEAGSYYSSHTYLRIPSR
jgi:hypothetical protein